jgi:perosamine synthetase
MSASSMDFIPVAGPWVTEREVRYTADAAANGWYANHNAYPDRFEKGFAKYLGVAHATSLPSCTSALHLALASLGVGAGDEVIVPDATWIATSAPVSYVGATPVFADVDEQSWCLDAAAFERAITPRTKAVIVVHLYGNMAAMDAITDVARRHGIAVIEDAAEAIGSEYRGRKAGAFGDAATFSFHGSKTLTTGEGGMLVTSRDDLFARVLRLRDHGREPGDRLFVNQEVAYKYKMSALQAAFGLAQLERIEELVARKREIFAWYARQLKGASGVTLNHEAPTTKNSYWMVTAVFDRELGLRKEYVIAALRERKIDSRPFFSPLSSLPAYRDLGGPARWSARNPVSYDIGARAVNLPSGFNMTEALVARVADALDDIVRMRSLGAPVSAG